MIHRIARTIAIALSLAVVGAACVSTSSSDQSAPQAVAPASGSMDHSSMASGSDTIDAGASGP